MKLSKNKRVNLENVQGFIIDFYCHPFTSLTIRKHTLGVLKIRQWFHPVLERKGVGRHPRFAKEKDENRAKVLRELG